MTTCQLNSWAKFSLSFSFIFHDCNCGVHIFCIRYWRLFLEILEDQHLQTPGLYMTSFHIAFSDPDFLITLFGASMTTNYEAMHQTRSIFTLQVWCVEAKTLMLVIDFTLSKIKIKRNSLFSLSSLQAIPLKQLASELEMSNLSTPRLTQVNNNPINTMQFILAFSLTPAIVTALPAVGQYTTHVEDLFILAENMFSRIPFSLSHLHSK